jgi:hypothetical protein
MEEARIGRDQPFVAHDEAPKVPQPGKRPLDDPPPPIPPQLAPILMGGTLMVAPGGDNRLNAPPRQASPQRVAIVTPIRNQALGPLARPPRLARAPDHNGVERLFEEGDFRRGSRLQVCSQRSTRAIDQNHPLCVLPALRLADFGSPFFAGIKLPSAKHSSHRIFCWSLSWAKKARQSLSSTPVSSHCLSRRQQVEGLPCRRGSSLHWAPVQRTQRMPSKQRRSSTRGRPPRGETLTWGQMDADRFPLLCGQFSPCHGLPSRFAWQHMVSSYFNPWVLKWLLITNDEMGSYHGYSRTI